LSAHSDGHLSLRSINLLTSMALFSRSAEITATTTEVPPIYQHQNSSGSNLSLSVALISACFWRRASTSSCFESAPDFPHVGGPSAMGFVLKKMDPDATNGDRGTAKTQPITPSKGAKKPGREIEAYPARSTACPSANELFRHTEQAVCRAGLCFAIFLDCSGLEKVWLWRITKLPDGWMDG